MYISALSRFRTSQSSLVADDRDFQGKQKQEFDAGILIFSGMTTEEKGG